MRKKNLSVKRKAKIKLSTTNSKIKKIYSKFRSVTLKKVGKKDFALAVSGGSDSLCLAYLGKIYTSELGNKMHVLIVDHNLRKESHKEALLVKKILKSKGIQSKLLSWKGLIPKSNIQSKARNIRFSIIANYCKDKKIKFLFTAHHMDDQIENFFIRLFRGSGLSGLSSMTETFDYNNSLKIIRPLLDFKKEDLKYLTIGTLKRLELKILCLTKVLITGLRNLINNDCSAKRLSSIVRCAQSISITPKHF